MKSRPPLRHWNASLPHWVQLALTGALIVVAVLQAVIIWLQTGIMGTQAKIMDTQANIMGETLTQTRIATTAATNQATAAQSQAQTAIDEQRSHRARVDFDEVKIDQPLIFEPTGLATLRVNLEARNIGNSPATAVVLEYELQLRWPAGNMNDFINHVCQPRQRPPYLGMTFSGLVPPGVTIPPGGAKAFPAKLGAPVGGAYKDNSASVWFGICLRYQDEQGNSHGTGQLFHYIHDRVGPIAIPSEGPIEGTILAITPKIAY